VVAKLNIIVIEDNDDLRTLLCNGLRVDGHLVTGLSSAEEMEDQAGIDHADAFLIDINLPGEDGLSLAKRIRKAHPLVGIICPTSACVRQIGVLD
jgi:DNA-binding response OmpR family regulator